MKNIARALKAGFLCVPIALAQPGVAQSTSAPPIILRAGANYRAELHGFVGMQRHFNTTISGAIHHTEQSDSGQILLNGAYAGIKYYSILEDGEQFSAAKLAQRDSTTNKDWSAGKVFFKEPYDPRYFGDYQFAGAKDGGGQTAVQFSSSIHDSQHGAGTVWIDDRTAHVVKLTYSPYVLPPHATSGTVTEIGGQALPKLWYVVRIDESYQGKVFVLHGSGVFTGTFNHFRRFPNLQSAQAALANGSI